MNAVATGRFAVWLMPCERHRAELGNVIRRLANEHGAPAFEPHVTVFAGSRTRDDATSQLLADAIAGVGILELQSTGFGFTADFYKTVFLAFEPDSVLARISRHVGMHLRQRQTYDLRPHLSLVYKELVDSEKLAIIERLGSPLGRIVFDAIAIAIPGPTNDWRDVANWRIESVLRLEGHSL